MSGEEQERFEDYLELERYIEGLQAGRVVYPPEGLTPEQARIYRMAALFRSASPEAIEPRPEFAEELRARLHLLMLEEVVQEEDTQKRPAIKKPAAQAQPEAPVVPATVPTYNESQEHESVTPPPEMPQPPDVLPVPQPAMPRKARFVSRRALLTGGAVAAASLAVGAGIGNALKPPDGQISPQPSVYLTTPLVPETLVKTKWQPVATLAELGNQAVKFVTDAVIGYVIINDGDDKTEPKEGDIIAFSAACTHMGCIVQWNGASRHFDCPCHNGRFTEYGKPAIPTANKPGAHYLAPLPRLNTRIENGKIYVEVPDNTPNNNWAAKKIIS